MSSVPPFVTFAQRSDWAVGAPSGILTFTLRQATEAVVRAALQTAAGFVWELTVPRGPDGRVKGFAFAAFTCLAHAQRAITNVNGKV